MKTSQSIIIILLTIAGLSWLSYTIIDQQKQIEQLQEQLQYEQMKCKIMINDPLARMQRRREGEINVKRNSTNCFAWHEFER